MGAIDAIGRVIKTSYIRIVNFIDSLLFDRYMEERLVRKYLVIAIYSVIGCLGVFATFKLSETHYGQMIVHPPQGTEIVIGITTVLLALFVPIAILLIEDAKGKPIHRLVITKYIIKFNITLIAIAIISVCLFVPQHITISGDFTARSVSGVIAIVSWLYIFQIFFNSSRWLTDSSKSTDGYDDPPTNGDPMPEAFKSYRFSQTLKFLAKSNSHDAWFHVWSKWYPPAYENELHKAFFNRQKRILNKKHGRKYPMISLELDAYSKYMIAGNRSVHDWRFGVTYLEGFLELYRIYSVERRRLSKVTSHNIKWTREYGAVVSATNVVSAITKEFINQNFTKDDAWSVAQAIAEYAKKLDVRYNDSGEPVLDPILTHFIKLLFEKLWDETIEYVDLEDFQRSNPDWAATDENLTKGVFPAMSMVHAMQDWITEKFELNSPEHTFGISNVMRFVYPKCSVSSMTELYWFKHVTRTTVDTNIALQKYVSENPNFNTYEPPTAEFVTPDKADEQLAQAVRDKRDRDVVGSEMFGKIYRTYFTSSHKITKIIKGINALSPTLGGNEQRRINYIYSFLDKIRLMYDREKREAAKQKQKLDVEQKDVGQN